MTPDADVENVALSGDGRYLAWIVNQEGYSRAQRAGSALEPGCGAAGDAQRRDRCADVSRSGGKVGFLMAGATHPNEVYVLDLERSTRDPA